MRVVVADLLRLGDRLAGDAIEAVSVLRHRRRLSRLGHRDSVRPASNGSLWAVGEPPPRAGNALDVLIDGEAVLPAIEQAIRSARSHVHIAGWSMKPAFELTRGHDPVVVRD